MLKGILARFSNFVSDLRNYDKLIGFQTWASKIEKVFDDFNDMHFGMELLDISDVFPELQFKEKNELNSKYFLVISNLKEIYYRKISKYFGGISSNVKIDTYTTQSRVK